MVDAQQAQRKTYALQVTGVSKSFDGERALDSVSLELAHGEIHGLLGHNGSGKSTLIKILAGFYTADEYEFLEVNGKSASLPLPPGVARSLGLAFVHQDLGLVAAATVAENMSISDFCEETRMMVRWGEEARRCRELLDRYDIAVPPSALVRDLPPVQKAMVAIARALREVERFATSGEEQARILVLDEPTAHLPRGDVAALFKVLRRMQGEGVSAIFVSHRTEEILELTDRVTVLRDGRQVGTHTTRGLTSQDIEHLILGERAASKREESRNLGTSFASRRPSREIVREGDARAPVTVTGLRGDVIEDLSFQVAPGEVLGFTGLASSGATEVPALLFGAQRAYAGSLEIQGRQYELPAMTPPRAVKSGLAFVPGDRLAKALIGDLTLLENVIPLVARNYSRLGAIRSRYLAKAAAEHFDQLGVRPPGPLRKASSLSGGNQQKVVMSKWLWINPSLLLLEEPTQGVDIGATEEIFKAIRLATGRGASVIVASTDEDDLAQMSDRVLVIRDGSIAAELTGAEVNKHSMRRAAG